MFVICNTGPYDAVGDAGAAGRIVSLLYPPPAMRWRGVTVRRIRHREAHRAPPAVCRALPQWVDLGEAARQLSVDQVAIRRINCSEGKAEFGPEVNGKRTHSTSAFIKETLDRGAEQFQ